MHCEKFISGQGRFLEESQRAGNEPAALLIRRSIQIALRVRFAREDEVQRLKDLNIAS